MATPKHRTAPGCSYFVTTKCGEGHATFQVAENAEILPRTLLHYRDSGAYLLHEFVIMPDLHLLITPSSTASLEKAVQLVKGGSSYRIHRMRGRNREIWQVGFYDWTIRDSADWETKVAYIHQNPVRARLVESPQDWPYSSATGEFRLDPTPERYAGFASGAKAPFVAVRTQGLKPLPPKEEHKTDTSL
jgi:putative transposase